VTPLTPCLGRVKDKLCVTSLCTRTSSHVHMPALQSSLRSCSLFFSSVHSCMLPIAPLCRRRQLSSSYQPFCKPGQYDFATLDIGALQSKADELGGGSRNPRWKYNRTHLKNRGKGLGKTPDGQDLNLMDGLEVDVRLESTYVEAKMLNVGQCWVSIDSVMWKYWCGGADYIGVGPYVMDIHDEMYKNCYWMSIVAAIATHAMAT